MSLMATFFPESRPPFSVESVKELFSTQVLPERARYKHPSPEAFDILTEKLNGEKVVYYWYINDMHPHAEQTAPMIQAAEFLSSELHKRIEDYSGSILPFSMAPTYFTQKRRDEILCLQNAFSAIQDLFEKTTAFRPVQHHLENDSTRWQAFAPKLAKLFREAMQTTNPTAKLGDHGQSPLARFVAAVLPKITGDAPTPDNVSMELRRPSKPRPTKRRHVARHSVNPDPDKPQA